MLSLLMRTHASATSAGGLSCRVYVHSHQLACLDYPELSPDYTQYLIEMLLHMYVVRGALQDQH